MDLDKGTQKSRNSAPTDSVLASIITSQVSPNGYGGEIFVCAGGIRTCGISYSVQVQLHSSLGTYPRAGTPLSENCEVAWGAHRGNGGAVGAHDSTSPGPAALNNVSVFLSQKSNSVRSWPWKARQTQLGELLFCAPACLS